MNPVTLENDLLNAANTGNLTAFENLVKHYLTPAAAAAIGAAGTGEILNALVYSPTTDTAGIDQVTADYLAKAGTVVDPLAVSQALDAFASRGDLTGVENVIHGAPASAFTGVSQATNGQDLLAIVNSPTTNTAGIDQATADFLAKAGAVVDPLAVSQALDAFANRGDLTGVENVIHGVPASAFTGVSQATNGQDLLDIVNSPTTNTAGIDQATADFLAKAGTVVDPVAVSQVLDIFANRGDLTGVENVIHGVPASAFSGVSQETNGLDLVCIVSSPTTNTAGIDQATADFLAKAGAYIDANDVSMAISICASDGNITGADNVINGIPASTFINTDPAALGQDLLDIAYSSQNTTDTAATDKATADFLAKAGAYVDANDVSNALNIFTGDGDMTGADNVINGVPVSTFAQLSPTALGQDLLNIIYSPTTDTAGMDKALSDFLGKVGADIDPHSVDLALQNLTSFGDMNGTESVLNNVPQSTFALIDTKSLDTDLMDIVGAPFHNAIGYVDNDKATSDFLVQAGAYVDSGTLAQAIYSFNVRGDLSGVDSVIGHLSAQQVTPALLSNVTWYGEHALTTGNDTYTASANNNNDNTIYGLNGNDVIDMHLNSGNHILFGDGGNDKLIGGAGSDYLNGGDGQNTLTGGAGVDTFAFDNTRAGTYNTVTDFHVSEGDKLDLSQLLTSFDPVTQAITDFVHATTQNGNTIISVDTDGKGTAAHFVAVATLTGVTGLDVNTLYHHGQIVA